MKIDESRQKAIVRGYSQALDSVLRIYRQTIEEIDYFKEMRDISDVEYEIELIRQIFYLDNWNNEEVKESGEDLDKLEEEKRNLENEVYQEEKILEQDIELLKNVARKYCRERERLHSLMEGLEDTPEEPAESYVEIEVCRRMKELFLRAR